MSKAGCVCSGGLLRLREKVSMENEEERGKSLSANDEVAAAAEAHGEVSAAAEVA